MSAKFIHENTDLKKQIGCMNGVFQLFHRHRFIAKRLHGHSNNSFHSDDKCANQAAESRSKVQKATQKGTNKVVKEKPTSTESSRTSFSSSSCSSSFSSADYARTIPIEIYLSSQTIPDLPTKRQTSTIQSSQPCFDFGDIIRNSMHRDVRGVALKTTTRDEAVVRTLKYIDSPRPSQLLKSLKHHNDSFQVFDNTNEQRDVCMHSSPKEIRRLSYDERDTLKSNINLKELPRLSLDSKANYSNDLQQEPESFKRSSSSVIVKLMGIEAFPDSTDSTSTSECQSKSWRGSETLGSKSSPSVYGEIEKILAELEFKKSGKDLIALKQNLESMRKTKGMLESQMSNNNSFDCNPSRTYRSPIIIMKPTKLNGKNTDPGSDVNSFDNSTSPCKLRLGESTFNKKGLVEKRTAKHPTKNNESTDHCHSSSTDKNAHKRTSKSVQTSKTSRNNSEGKGNKRCSAKGSGTASSKLQCKQFGLDNKESHQVSSSSESSRSRKHGTKQPIDSSSSTRKCMLGSPNLQRSKDKVNETKTSIRHHGNALSIHYESTTSFDSHPDGEIIFKTFGKNQRDVAAGLCGAEQGIASTEQPSPVSVLDTTLYRDDSPSPVKKISFDFEDEETLYPDEVKWRSMELAQLSSKIDTKTLEDTMKNLVQNPQLESFSKPDHKYISDILSASALNLDSGLTNIQLQNLNYVINPKMFFTLEKVKALDDENASEKTPQMKYNQVIHRKLVFDVVNEIVSQKLVVPYSFKQCLVPQPRGQHLLRKLCSVVDRLQDHDYGSLVDEDDNMRNILPEDLMDWLGCESEIPRMVLDIERLIFKDLITQVVSGMITCCKIDIAGNLFSK